MPLILFPLFEHLVRKLLANDHTLKAWDASATSNVEACHRHGIVHVQPFANTHNPWSVDLCCALQKPWQSKTQKTGASGDSSLGLSLTGGREKLMPG